MKVLQLVGEIYNYYIKSHDESYYCQLILNLTVTFFIPKFLRFQIGLSIRIFESSWGWFLLGPNHLGPINLNSTRYLKFLGSDSGRFLSDLGRFESIIKIFVVFGSIMDPAQVRVFTIWKDPKYSIYIKI